MSSDPQLDKLRSLMTQQQVLLAQLLEGVPMLRGSFSRVRTRCGKANCWCAQAGQGHPHARITWSQGGRLITRKVPEDYLDRVRQLVARYRKFRYRRRRLINLLASFKLALAAYEEALIERTRAPMPFLASTPAPLSQLPSLSPNRGTKS